MTDLLVNDSAKAMMSIKTSETLCAIFREHHKASAAMEQIQDSLKTVEKMLNPKTTALIRISTETLRTKAGMEDHALPICNDKKFRNVPMGVNRSMGFQDANRHPLRVLQIYSVVMMGM